MYYIWTQYGFVRHDHGFTHDLHFARNFLTFAEADELAKRRTSFAYCVLKA